MLVFHPPIKDYDFLEFYAGRARTTMAMRRRLLRSARFDLLYSEQKAGRRSNFMDLLHSSGFLPLVYYIETLKRILCFCYTYSFEFSVDPQFRLGWQSTFYCVDAPTAS